MKRFLLVLSFIVISSISFGFDFKCQHYTNDDMQFVCVTPTISVNDVLTWYVYTFNKMSQVLITERFTSTDYLSNNLHNSYVISSVQLDKKLVDITVNGVIAK